MIRYDNLLAPMVPAITAGLRSFQPIVGRLAMGSGLYYFPDIVCNIMNKNGALLGTSGGLNPRWFFWRGASGLAATPKIGHAGLPGNAGLSLSVAYGPAHQQAHDLRGRGRLYDKFFSVF